MNLKLIASTIDPDKSRFRFAWLPTKRIEIKDGQEVHTGHYWFNPIYEVRGTANNFGKWKAYAEYND